MKLSNPCPGGMQLQTTRFFVTFPRLKKGKCKNVYSPFGGFVLIPQKVREPVHERNISILSSKLQFIVVFVWTSYYHVHIQQLAYLFIVTYDEFTNIDEDSHDISQPECHDFQSYSASFSFIRQNYLCFTQVAIRNHVFRRQNSSSTVFHRLTKKSKTWLKGK